MDYITSSVISTRIRLARNIDGYPFPNMLRNPSTARAIANMVFDSLKNDRGDYALYSIKSLSSEDLERFKENYIVSEGLIRNGEFSYLIINRGENISIMINEEDHLREQLFYPGFSLEKAYEVLSATDRQISREVPFAVSEQLGYLTACPTNLGTGMRSSVMLFLPAIARNKEIRGEVEKRFRAHGVIIRGMYGEGSDTGTGMFQISNEWTLGIREEEILERVSGDVKYVCQREIAETRRFKEEDVAAFEDMCGRAYGVLCNSAVLFYGEFADLMAKLKMGISMGFYTAADMNSFMELLVVMRDSNIVYDKEFYEDASPDRARAIYRAKIVRNAISTNIKRAF